MAERRHAICLAFDHFLGERKEYIFLPKTFARRKAVPGGCSMATPFEPALSVRLPFGSWPPFPTWPPA